MTLRLVHDPDTGCYACHGSRLDDDGLPWFCGFSNQQLPIGIRYLPAPPWCPLRTGDVVVTAGKDGG